MITRSYCEDIRRHPQDSQERRHQVRRKAVKSIKMQLYRWLLLAGLVASGLALACQVVDPEDPDRCLIFNSTTVDEPKSSSVAPTASKAVLTHTEKVKFAFEVVGGSVSVCAFILAIYFGIRRGDRLEDIVAQVHPFLAQLREIWRCHPATPQTDLIDL